LLSPLKRGATRALNGSQEEKEDRRSKGRMPMKIDLTGRIALVPGGSGGIGSAIAQVLAECGADIAIGFGKNKQRADEVASAAAKAGVRVRTDQVDATDRDRVRAWVNSVIGDFGKIDILANCVGSDGGFQLFREQDPSRWPMLVAQHFWAGIYLVEAVLPAMQARRWGRIIHLSSDGAKVGQSGVAVANGASAGLIGFSKGLAREVARDGVTVNAVCAGPTRTPVLDAMIAAGDTGAKLAAGAARAIPMKRIGEPSEVAAIFAFLASDAGSYVTGQALSVSGGLTMS
jgi:2-hydroxycyclohexanecarboxyl-CoA dehydrogenase